MTSQLNNPRNNNIPLEAPIMSRSAFAAWGTDEIAYVRPATQGQINGYAVHTADGREVGFVETYELAAATIIQNELYPLSVH